MTTRVCSRCKTEKGADAYHNNKRSPDGLHSYCKPCHRDYYRDKKKSDPDMWARMKRDLIARRTRYVAEIKAQRGCLFCNERHPACLEFHHRDRSKKFKTVSHIVAAKYSMARLHAEMEKCDVLCSNCHRKLHHEERERPSYTTNLRLVRDARERTA